MTCQVVLRSTQKVFTSEEKCQIIDNEGTRIFPNFF